MLDLCCLITNQRKQELNKLFYTFKNFTLGIIVGFTDLFPAISGSTILMIFGKYYDLFRPLNHIINSLISFNKFEKNKLNLGFTIPLLIGIIFSIFTFSNLAEYLFLNERVLTIAFITTFITLIVIRNLFKIKKPSKYLIFFLTGFLSGMSLILIPENLFNSQSYLIIFLSGTIALSFMIIPGVSGSLMLIAIGSYESLISAVSNFEILYLFIFSMGGIIGLLISVKIISKIINLLKNNFTIFLYGLILGTVPKFFTQISLENYYSLKALITILLASIIVVILLIILEKYENSF